MIRPSARAQREAERRYPVSVRIAVPPEGLGRQLAIMHAWLDVACGAAGWASRSISSCLCSCLCRPLLLRLPGRDNCGSLCASQRCAL